MPFPWIKPATRKDTQAGTSGYGDIGDDKAWMVSRQCVMYSIRENVEAVIEKEDEEQDDEGQDAQLEGRPKLREVRKYLTEISNATYDSTCHAR